MRTVDAERVSSGISGLDEIIEKPSRFQPQPDTKELFSCLVTR